MHKHNNTASTLEGSFDNHFIHWSDKTSSK